MPDYLLDSSRLLCIYQRRLWQMHRSRELAWRSFACDLCNERADDQAHALS